jgi:hypothetical protein
MTKRCLFPVLALAAACSSYDAPDIVGEWQSSAPVGNLGVNTLSVRDSLNGDATVRFYWTDEDGVQHGAALDYSVACEPDGDGTICELTCNESGLTSYDFTMKCPAGDERIRCTGNRLFSSYEFEWERR